MSTPHPVDFTESPHKGRRGLRRLFKRAKDLGSAAVLIALSVMTLVWVALALDPLLQLATGVMSAVVQ